jgi:5-deoxy-D-glucuronate isomerase
VLYKSSSIAKTRSGTAIEITRRQAGWRFVHFAVRQIAPGRAWHSRTGTSECCLVLLAGTRSNCRPAPPFESRRIS